MSPWCSGRSRPYNLLYEAGSHQHLVLDDDIQPILRRKQQLIRQAGLEAAARQKAEARDMTSSYAELAQLATRWIEEGWQQGNAAMVDALHSTDFVDRAAAGRAADREGFKQGIRDLYEAFPDFRARVEDLVVDEGRQMVTVRWTALGTQRGAFLGVDATGRQIRFQGIEIIRVQAGRIAERWGEWDGLSLVEQLRAPA